MEPAVFSVSRQNTKRWTTIDTTFLEICAFFVITTICSPTYLSRSMRKVVHEEFGREHKLARPDYFYAVISAAVDLGVPFMPWQYVAGLKVQDRLRSRIRMEAIAIWLEAIASRLEAIAFSLEAIATRLVDWRPFLLGWRPSQTYILGH